MQVTVGRFLPPVMPQVGWRISWPLYQHLLHGFRVFPDFQDIFTLGDGVMVGVWHLHNFAHLCGKREGDDLYLTQFFFRSWLKQPPPHSDSLIHSCWPHACASQLPGHHLYWRWAQFFLPAFLKPRSFHDDDGKLQIWVVFSRPKNAPQIRFWFQ